jgi:hypothetical protein
MGLHPISATTRCVSTALSIHTIAFKYSLVFAILAMQADTPSTGDSKVEGVFKERRDVCVRATALSETPKHHSLRSSFFPSPTTESGWTAVDLLTRVPELLLWILCLTRKDALAHIQRIRCHQPFPTVRLMPLH